jgi:competence protein ComEA
VGVIAILAMVAGVVGWNFWRASVSASSGITLREPGAEAPATRQSVSAPPATSDNAIHMTTVADPPSASAPTVSQLVVHVVGAVRRPGVYRLPVGARNDDALRAAGGATDEANTVAVNLAARVEDGTQLYIPTRQAHPEDHAAAGAATFSASSPSISQTAMTAANSTLQGKKSAGHAHSGTGHNGKAEKLTAPGQDQIDLNAASAQELQRVPGIGPAMAERLIAYRQQNGGFHAVEDLLQVSGIGEKKYAKIQPYVRVH